MKDIEGRAFTLDTGVRELEVDTDEMTYNPLDEVGAQQLKEGDRVSVYGKIEDNLFEDSEIEARAVMSLIKDRGRSSN